MERLVEEGGRVDWYKGDRHELIAYDAISDYSTRNTELYTIEPDGSGKRCVTCDSGIRKGFVGQPAWHPDGRHLIIQVENENSGHTLFNHMSWGFDNDLWIISRDGTEAEPIWTSPSNHAALHPHFNKDGTKLIFAERIPTGRTIPLLGIITPGGENQWEGWQIHIADFDITNQGTGKLSNHRAIKPNGDGFYETHQLTEDGRMVYSFTPSGKPYVDDIYIADINGTNVQGLIENPATWDEHGSYSPSERSLAFNSSRVDPSWKAPTSRAITLSTELYLKDVSGEVRQITELNAKGDPTKRYITSDFDWDRTGRRIVFQAGSIDNKTGLPDSVQVQLWMITFSSPQ